MSQNQDLQGPFRDRYNSAAERNSAEQMGSLSPEEAARREISQRLPTVVDVRAELLSAVKRHAATINHACLQDAAANGSLQGLEEELVSVGLSPEGCIAHAGEHQLRSFLGLVINSRQLESAGRYGLVEMHQVLTSHVNAFEALLSQPLVAHTLGAALAYPSLFSEFSQNRDVHALELVTIKMRKALSVEAFDRWQELLATSILLSYQGIQESGSPSLYVKATQLPPGSCVLNSEVMRESVIGLFAGLLRVGEPIPTILWDTLHSNARREVALHIPVQDAIFWMNQSLRDIAIRLKKCHKLCCKFNPKRDHSRPIDSSNQSVAAVTAEMIVSDFEQSCCTLLEVSRFFTAYLDAKRGNLAGDPLRALLLPKRATDRTSYEKNPSSYEDAKLRELIQRKIGRNVVAALREACTCLSHKSVALSCSEEFSQGVVEMLDELNLYLDCGDEGGSAQGFYQKHLLPCFDKAMRLGDLKSASAIRLLFPSDDRETPTVRRFLVDDYISAHQKIIVQALVTEARGIEGRLMQAARSGERELPRVISESLTAFKRSLRHFPLVSSIEAMDLDLMCAAAAVVRALILWDAGAEHLADENQEDKAWKATIRSDLRVFEGCRKAAEVISTLHVNRAFQRHVMRAVFSGQGSGVEATLGAFITHVNLKLAQALRGLASSKLTLDDVLPECDAAFAAQRLYASSIDQHDRLPEVMIRYLSPLLDVGYRILKNQELLIAPPSDMSTVRADDLICVRSWQQGLIGKTSNAHRHSLMIKFFNFVQEHGGIVPEQARPLVFDSVACFAQEFAARLMFDSRQVEFVQGVSYVLSAFLISSPQMNPEPRAEIAKALIPVFESSQALLLCGSRQQVTDIVEELHVLVDAAGTERFDSSLKEFLASRVMQELLGKLGLVAVDSHDKAERD